MKKLLIILFLVSVIVTSGCFRTQWNEREKIDNQYSSRVQDNVQPVKQEDKLKVTCLDGTNTKLPEECQEVKDFLVLYDPKKTRGLQY